MFRAQSKHSKGCGRGDVDVDGSYTFMLRSVPTAHYCVGFFFLLLIVEALINGGAYTWPLPLAEVDLL